MPAAAACCCCTVRVLLRPLRVAPLPVACGTCCGCSAASAARLLLRVVLRPLAAAAEAAEGPPSLLAAFPAATTKLTALGTGLGAAAAGQRAGAGAEWKEGEGAATSCLSLLTSAAGLLQQLASSMSTAVVRLVSTVFSACVGGQEATLVQQKEGESSNASHTPLLCRAYRQEVLSRAAATARCEKVKQQESPFRCLVC
jgi:hypothetical protein